MTDKQKYSVPCWNCDEGYIEDEDGEEWGCSECRGKGYLIVSELTDENYEYAVPIKSSTEG